MAYNNRNFLLRVQDVVEAYQQAKTDDVTFARVYRKVIKPRYRISRSTLYNYLNIPYKRLLAQIDEREKQKNEKNNVLKLDL